MIKQRRYRVRHKSLGLCIYCPNSAAMGHTMCSACIEKARQKRERRKKNNQCVRCGKPLDLNCDSKTSCINCNEHEDRPLIRHYWRMDNANFCDSQYAKEV